MCGIVGIFGNNGTATEEKLNKAVEVLYHRGPDGRRILVNENRSAGLGHTRLSIIDLEGGAQPLSNEDGSIYAVVNGELYDFERIRQVLTNKGHTFATGSDSELLIHLYEEHGLDAVSKIRGEFAFILWDSRQSRLYAGRDRFGIKPLFYCIQDGSIYLASEIKALIGAGIKPYWDEESLYVALLIMGVPVQNRTFFRDIYQIPPGYYLIWNNGACQKHKYWDFDYPRQVDLENKAYSEPQIVEQFRHQFEEAVRLRLRADVPVGVYLSGGIDSCSILGTVAKLRGSGTKAFTISFSDINFDEFSIAREMAELTGTEFNAFPISSAALAENFISSVYHSEGLSANAHSVAKYILSRHVRESGYKVVLTGEGSDEILGGYSHFRQDMVQYDTAYQNQFVKKDALSVLAKANTAFAALFPVKQNKQVNNIVAQKLGFTPAFLIPQINREKSSKQLFHKKSLKNLLHVDPFSRLLDDIDIEKQMEGRHPLHQSLYLWSKYALPNYMLSNLGDRMEMGNSIEGRLPFLDHHLVEFVTRLPVSFKIRNMKEKYLLREALRPVLSKTVYERQKHPFMAPPSTGQKKEPLFRFLSEYVCDNAHKLPLFDSFKLKALVKVLPFLPLNVRISLDPVLVLTASMTAMQDQFGMSVK